MPCVEISIMGLPYCLRGSYVCAVDLRSYISLVETCLLIVGAALTTIYFYRDLDSGYNCGILARVGTSTLI